MDLHDAGASLFVRMREFDFAIETTGSKERRIEDVDAIGGGDNLEEWFNDMKMVLFSGRGKAIGILYFNNMADNKTTMCIDKYHVNIKDMEFIHTYFLCTLNNFNLQISTQY